MVDLSIDDGFCGTSHETLPEPDIDLSCKDCSTPVDPDVVVDIKQDIERRDFLQPLEEAIGIEFSTFEEIEELWVRIPVTKVEEWVNKDGPADMTRTAKVNFPFEWGDRTIIKYINGFNSQNNIAEQNDPYDECRIFFYDEDIDEWVTSHYGYVGGVGPSSESDGLGKFWVYDPADLMKGIQVSKSWGEPTLQNVVDFALRGVDEQGNDVGLENRSVFDGPIPTTILGVQDIPQQKRADVREIDPTGDFVITLPSEIPVIGSIRIPVGGLVGDIFDWSAENILDPLLKGQKRFQINRHNMVDHMDWITDLIDARWWFEPSPEGPVLVIDATAYKSGEGEGAYERRYFVDDEAMEEFTEIQQQARREAIERAQLQDEVEDPIFGTTVVPAEEEFLMNDDVPDDFLPPHNYEVFANIDTLNNSALVDIKPFNTLYLYGESTTFRERYQPDSGIDFNPLVEYYEDLQVAGEDAMNFKDAAGPGGFTEQFPYVKLTYQPLLDRAGGYEYSSQPVESDKIYLNEAEKQARKEFRNHLAEETEGSMEIRGEPHIMPYDYIYTMPTCNDTYLNANAEPITWEVNGVKHTREAGKPFTTELGVSLAVEEFNIETDAEYREA